jgi:hypothetical protein
MIPWLSNFAADCVVHTFFGIPPWYQYLIIAKRMTVDATTGVCEMIDGFRWGAPDSPAGNDLVLILMGVLDIVFRIAAFVAIGFIIYAGIRYITSDGAPDQTKEAQSTLINALIGLVITLIATGTVSFIGRMLSR